MAEPAARFERRREALIARLETLVRDDPRLAALWLQGSLADGTADPLSDVDAFVAVEDGAFEQVYGERAALVRRLGSVLAGMDATTPGLRGVHCLLDGPIKLDLFLEPLSAAPERERPAVRMLIDKAGLGPRLRTGWRPSREAAAQRLDTMFRMSRQGATWPIRLLARGQWATFAMVELELINDNLAILLAAQLDPGLLFSNRLSYPRLLRPERRAQLEELTAALLAALVQRDLPALREVHLRINDAIVSEGRTAYAALGLTYPGSAEGDAAIRAFYLREWPA